MIIALLPARGGSKRIKRKNVRDFNGKPIMSWVIDALNSFNIFDHILVSTDDEEVARIANDCGAQVPFVRPAEISDDYSSTVDVVSHATKWMLAQGWKLKAVCCIYPTSVFLTKTYLEQGYNALRIKNVSFSMSVAEFERSAFRALSINGHGALEPVVPEFFIKRTQDVGVSYYDAAQFYWGLPEAWCEVTNVFEKNCYPIVLPRHRAIDIDNESDWLIAEKEFRKISLS